MYDCFGTNISKDSGKRIIVGRIADAYLDLSPGDWLLFCSDGFIEDRDAAGVPVGYDGFLRRLQQLDSADRSTASSGAALLEALFATENRLSTAPDDPLTADDRTLVLIVAGSAAFEGR